MKYVTEMDKSELINKLAIELKKVEQISKPSWAVFVKTGTHKERPPVQEDWWYMRTASVMVKILYRGPVGVSKLRTLYGGKKRRGHKPAEFRRASGNILRKILQQLETAGFVKQTKIGVHKGRILTPKGQSFINSVGKASIKPVSKKPVEIKKDSPIKPKETPIEKPKPKVIKPQEKTDGQLKTEEKEKKPKKEDKLEKSKTKPDKPVKVKKKQVKESK